MTRGLVLGAVVALSASLGTQLSAAVQRGAAGPGAGDRPPDRAARTVADPQGARGVPASPDIIAGDIPNAVVFGRVGDRIGASISSVACNAGDSPANWLALPAVIHPVFVQNMYRYSDGRFEQIGQSWAFHEYFPLQSNSCALGCDPDCAGSGTLCPGCSTPTTAGVAGGPSMLGSRALINPWTGEFPSNAADHAGHAHNSLSHRLILADSDLAAPGATYYVETQYVSSDEAADRRFNNASHRRVIVNGVAGGSYTLAMSGGTIVQSPAIDAWPDADQTVFEPEPGMDGQAVIAYTATSLGDGRWRYEYAVWNRNLNRAIREFAVPVGAGADIEDLTFHSPLQHPGFPNDGTFMNEGFSDSPWTASVSDGAVRWSTSTFVQDPNANAIRWGTLYNFGFTADAPPADSSATLGLFLPGGNGAPDEASASIVGPVACAADWDRDGEVTSQDFFDFIGDFFDGNADINNDGQTTSQDFFDFLGIFTTGC